MRKTPNTRAARTAPIRISTVERLWALHPRQPSALLNREPTIDAISVTTHGATAALLDADGALALPVLDYEHDGPDSARRGL